jgi:hypothetical protein
MQATFFNHTHALSVDCSNLAIDRVGDLARGKREPHLICVPTAHASICVLEDLIAHATLRLVFANDHIRAPNDNYVNQDANAT